MSELAFNMHGDPFEVPANATGWRVRRMKAKGAPEVVYGRNGLPLVLPIDAEVDDLRAETSAAGRYRLDPVADNNKPIDDAPAGYVFVHECAPAALATERAAMTPASDNIVIEAMRMNSELARSIVDRFPQMMESAALLIRAADGAGIPARAPRAVEEDDEASETAPAPGFDLNTFVAQAMPIVIAGLSSGNFELPSLASLFDWRKATPAPAAKADGTTPSAAPKARAAAKAADAKPSATTEPPPADSSALPPLAPATMAHFIAIQSALQPDEAALAREVASELAPAELRAWFDELAALSVPDAVAKVRSLIAKGGVS